MSSAAREAKRLAPSIQRLILGRTRTIVRRSSFSPRFSSDARKVFTAEEIPSPDPSPSLLDVELAEKLERYIRAKRHRSRKASKIVPSRAHPTTGSSSEQGGKAITTTVAKKDRSEDGKNTSSSTQVSDGLVSDEELSPLISNGASYRSLAFKLKTQMRLNTPKHAPMLDRRKATTIKRSSLESTSQPETSITQRTSNAARTSELDGEYQYLVNRRPHDMTQKALGTRDDIIQTLRRDILRASENFPRPTPTDPYATFCESLGILMEAELTAAALNSGSSKPDRQFYAVVAQRLQQAMTSLHFVKCHLSATRTKIMFGLSGLSDLQNGIPMANHYGLKKGWSHISKAKSLISSIEDTEQSTSSFSEPYDTASISQEIGSSDNKYVIPSEERREARQSPLTDLKRKMGKSTTWSRELRLLLKSSSIESESPREDEHESQPQPGGRQDPSSLSLLPSDIEASKVRGTRHLVLDQTIDELKSSIVLGDGITNKMDSPADLDETSKGFGPSVAMDETTEEPEPPFEGMHGTWLPFDANFNEGPIGFEMKKKGPQAISLDETRGGKDPGPSKLSDLVSSPIEEDDALEPLLENYETSLLRGTAPEDPKDNQEITEGVADPFLNNIKLEEAPSDKITSQIQEVAGEVGLSSGERENGKINSFSKP